MENTKTVEEQAHYMIRCFGKKLALKTAQDRAVDPELAPHYWTSIAKIIESLPEDFRWRWRSRGDRQNMDKRLKDFIEHVKSANREWDIHEVELIYELDASVVDALVEALNELHMASEEKSKTSPCTACGGLGRVGRLDEGYEGFACQACNETGVVYTG